MILQISVCSIFRYLVSSVSQSLHLFFVISSYFPFLLQSACDKSSHCQNNATCQSGFTLKGYRCLCPPGFEGESCETGISLSQHLKWCIWHFLAVLCKTRTWNHHNLRRLRTETASSLALPSWLLKVPNIHSETTIALILSCNPP